MACDECLWDNSNNDNEEGNAARRRRRLTRSRITRDRPPRGVPDAPDTSSTVVGDSDTGWTAAY